jgi:hypothetical protein
MSIFSRVSNLARDVFDRPFQLGGFVYVTSKPPAPDTSRWFRAFGISGKPCGLAFSCPTCRLEVRFNAPARIQHCGHIEERPVDTAALPERRIQGAGSMPGIIDTWELDCGSF